MTSYDSLYNLTTDMLELEMTLDNEGAEVEYEDGTRVSVTDYLLAIKEEELADKVDAYVRLVRSKESSIKARKVEIKELQDTNKVLANGVVRLKEAAKEASARLGKPKLLGRLHTITVSHKDRPAIEIVDEAMVPDEYKTEVVTISIDKKAIADHLMATGEIVPGTETRSVVSIRLK